LTTISLSSALVAQQSAGRSPPAPAGVVAARSPGVDPDLTEAERRTVAELRRRDQEVRRHEQAHARAGGQYAGAPTCSYTRGPDGRLYATGGSTPIDVSPVSGDPDATICKMEAIKRAAFAPADPSDQDRAVAARADQEIARARQETKDLGPEGANAAAGPPGAARPRLPGSLLNILA